MWKNICTSAIWGQSWRSGDDVFRQTIKSSYEFELNSCNLTWNWTCLGHDLMFYVFKFGDLCTAIVWARISTTEPTQGQQISKAPNIMPCPSTLQRCPCHHLCIYPSHSFHHRTSRTTLWLPVRPFDHKLNTNHSFRKTGFPATMVIMSLLGAKTCEICSPYFPCTFVPTSLQELRHVLGSVGEKLSPSELDDLNREADPDSTGVISYPVFLKAMLAK